MNEHQIELARKRQRNNYETNDRLLEKVKRSFSNFRTQAHTGDLLKGQQKSSTDLFRDKTKQNYYCNFTTFLISFECLSII